jgi:hypothetical protein
VVIAAPGGRGRNGLALGVRTPRHKIRSLQKTGVQHRNRFRFRNPMLQPYIIMKALGEEQIDLATLDRFLATES